MLGTKIANNHWPFPEKEKIVGQYVRLEPLSLTHHGDLWLAARDAPESFTYLRYGPFIDPKALSDLLIDLSSRSNQPFWAVIGQDDVAQGWISICDVYQADGAFEIGSIWFSPSLQGTRKAREAIFLLMCLGMDTLDYERLVWRCQAQNNKSFQAAINLGFHHEGTWRNAAIVDGWQRDIGWFSILRDEWPVCREAFVGWLSTDNFDAFGNQKLRLQELRVGQT
ncbi:MAG: GNAT family protein [Sulfitobacter sp.]